jgi:hypothetical protein
LIFYPVTLRRFEPDASTPVSHHAVAAYQTGANQVYLNRTPSTSEDAASRSAAKASEAFKDGKFTVENSENWTPLPLSIVPAPGLVAA